MPPSTVVPMLQQLLAHYIQSAGAAHARGDHGAAKEWCGHAIRMAPDMPEAWFSLGLALRGLNHATEAVKAFVKAGTLTQRSAEAQNSIGVQLLELGADADAEKCLNRSIELAPTYAFAHSNLGRLRDRQGRLEEADACFRKAIELQPDLAPLHANLGGVLIARNDFTGAQAACQRAVELEPALPDGWRNLGIALGELKRFPEAEAAYRTAIELEPASPEAWSNLGNLLTEALRLEEAEAAYRKALDLDPRSAETWSNLGNAQREQKRFEAAIESLERARVLKPTLDYVQGTLLATRARVCDWTSFASDTADLARAIAAGHKAAKPFDVLSLSADPGVQRAAAQTWSQDRWPQPAPALALGTKQAKDKITVGYFSADFHDHATAQLMIGFFERHDRSAFETIAFDFGPPRDDEMARRLAVAFDRFMDVRAMADGDIADLSRRLGVDIAVDLKGFTQDSRPGIFARRAAPIQVSYLGYPGTLGCGWMDYLIADPVVVPPASYGFYAEKIVQLPHSYQVNDAERPIADTPWRRADAGLPEAGFVFCCFNNSFKINPEVLDAWMRILSQVEDSVLWLLEDTPAAARHLVQEAARRGVAAERLVFAPRVPVAEHLARHRLADLFLDTLPYNAHTTASDALWAGLPVLTCMGDAFASRVAASLLTAVGLADLIAPDRSAYERLAVDLATAPDRLGVIRRRLADKRLTMPLFDTALSTRHIEAAWVAMMDRHRRGLAPEHLQVTG